MATTYPLPTLAATVTAAGITAPSYEDVRLSLLATYQSIFGTDAYLEPDSQDGQLLAAIAQAITDANNAAILVYNSFSPATAQGAALSNNVKLNGLTRNLPSNSQVVLTIVGQVGTTINNGVASDAADNRWLLPAVVVIPLAGFIDVTATCADEGAIEADPGSITRILTPTLGWQTVTNAASASPGAAVESDAQLRQRQTSSTALPSQTVLAGILGAVLDLDGVTAAKAYENDTDAADANGLPEHSIALVVLGGVAADIGEAIYLKKTPGAYTHGTTSVIVTDDYGIANTIRYFIPTEVAINVAITIKARTGYTSAIGDQLKQAIADYISGLGIGVKVDIGRLYLPAQLFGAAGFETYEVDLIEVAESPAVPGPTDVPIDFNAIATCDVADIDLTVT